MKRPSILSPKAIAWTIVAISIASLPLHAFISHHASSKLSGLSFVGFAVTLLLGLIHSRTDTKRFLPSLCALLVCFVHSFLVDGL